MILLAWGTKPLRVMSGGQDTSERPDHQRSFRGLGDQTCPCDLSSWLLAFARAPHWFQIEHYLTFDQHFAHSQLVL